MDLAGPFPELKSHDVSISKPDDSYLSDFTRLGEQIYYYTPPRTSTPTMSDRTDISATTIARESTPSDVRDPDLVIICSWMYAHPRHIAKYTRPYQARYPTSPILLLRQDGGDFFWRSHTTQMRNLEPAVRVIRTLCSGGGGGGSSSSSSTGQESDTEGLETKPNRKSRRRPRVLKHVFSNGGAWTACQLADAYKHSAKDEEEEEAEEASAILPIDALILDSTPSLPDPRASHAAICEALPSRTTYPLTRKAGELAVWWYLTLASRVDALVGREHLTLNIRRRLNDPEGPFMMQQQQRGRGLGLGLGLPRVYIYSDGDKLIPAADVESHAEEAKEKRRRIIEREKMEESGAKESNANGNANANGTNDGNGNDDDTGIWLENFGQTRHVGHMLGDPDRYWGVVERVWRGIYENKNEGENAGEGEGEGEYKKEE